MAELTRLGRYQLKQVLGRGAMGVVYEGLDPSLNRRVAVKTILKNAAIDAETARHYSAQFAREAQAAGRLNHPNIVQVHDFAEEGDIAYLVMEYIQGRELRSFFEAKERFDVAETVRIMGELLDALDFAHEAGVIHRDVKPANVMLDAQRRVKLADFGVARIQDSERSAAGTMVGTPAFMSPEQIQGLKIDRRTDIFSAGTILYQLLTGDQPFTGQGAWTVAKKIMEDNPPQPSSVVKSVSPAFDAIVDKALAKKASDRYASAREFAAALRAAVAPAQASAPPGTPAISAPKAKSAPQASETELEFWRAIQNSTDAAEFEFYLEQFPDGTYAGLARHKIAKLHGAKSQDDEATVKLQAEAAAKQRQLEEQAQREAQEKARREAAEKARREEEERAKQEALDRARREAEEKARREAAAKAKREAEEKARRETEEKVRQAQALARLKQQEEAAAKAKAKAKPAADEDSTVALPPRRSETAAVAAPPAAKSRSVAVPAAIVAVVVVGGVAAYLLAGRTPPPAPAPVAAVAPAKPEVAPAPAVDADKIRRETEERLRKEFAEKAAAERAAMEKSVAEKLAAERAAAEKVTQAKTAAEKAAAEKAAAAALAARMAAEKAAAAKAAENASAERANAERAAIEKAAAERAAAEKVAAEKAAAERAAAEKAVAEKQAAAAVSQEALLERFIQRKGRDKVMRSEPPPDPFSAGQAPELPFGHVVYVNDGSCGPGGIKQVTGGSVPRNAPRTYRCISLADDKPMAGMPGAASPTATPPAARPAAPLASSDGDAQLERFIRRVGRDKVLKEEPPIGGTWGGSGALASGEVVYVNDGSCPPGRIREVAGTNAPGTHIRGRPSRCISLADDGPAAVKPAASKPAATAPAAAALGSSADADAQLERFIQRKGRDKVMKEEPPLGAGALGSDMLRSGEVVYVNDGSCPPGRIREVTGTSAMGANLRGRPSRCISLTD